MNNREINEKNLNLLEEEASNYLSDNDNIIESDFNSKEHKGLINQLKSQIAKLNLCLEEKNKEIIESDHQCTFIKIDYVKLQEQCLIKDTIINDFSNQNSKLKLDNTSLKAENEELKNQVIELNNKLIEFNQKLASLEIKSNFQKKLDSINQSNTLKSSSLFEKEKLYEIEISKLTNQIDEIQIEKAKLVFELKALKIQFEEAQLDKNNESIMNKRFYDQTIENHKKTISSLQKQLIDLQQKESNKIQKFSNKSIAKQSLINETLLIQLDEIGSRAKAFDSENYILTKKIQFYEDEIAEYKIKIENKDKIILKLQKDLDNFVSGYKKQYETIDSTAIMKSKEVNELIQRNEELMVEINNLTNQNNELQNGLNEMTQGLQDTNNIVRNKMTVYENELYNEQEKNRSYKEKITNLKAKIDELYSEIDTYKLQLNRPNQNQSQSQSQYQHETITVHSQRMNTEPSIKKDKINTYATIEIEDPYESNQRKAIEDYKQILKRVDLNLQKYKGSSVIKSNIIINQSS